MDQMKRATISLPDELDRELQRYIERHEAPPSLTSVVQLALKEFLQRQRLKDMEFRPPRGPFRITPDPKGSGHHDISVEHDRYSTGRE